MIILASALGIEVFDDIWTPQGPNASESERRLIDEPGTIQRLLERFERRLTITELLDLAAHESVTCREWLILELHKRFSTNAKSWRDGAAADALSRSLGYPHSDIAVLWHLCCKECSTPEFEDQLFAVSKNDGIWFVSRCQREYEATHNDWYRKAAEQAADAWGFASVDDPDWELGDGECNSGPDA